MNRLVVGIAMVVLLAGRGFAQEGPVEVPPNVMKAMIRTKVDPVYPPSAIATGVSGIVALHAIIDKYGQIAKLDVIKGPEPLRPSALEAVKQWTFVPYIVNRQSTAVSTTILIQYGTLSGFTITRGGIVEHHGPSSPQPFVDILSEEPNLLIGLDTGGFGGMARNGRMKAGAYMSEALAPEDPVGKSESASLPAGTVRLAGGITSGTILKKVQPEYPAIARLAHVDGAVVLHALINEAGTIDDLSVISGPPMLTTAAINAVKQWTYKPYLVNGKPTKVDTTITVNFNFGQQK